MATNRSFNVWKWLFIGLVTFIILVMIGGGLYLSQQVQSINQGPIDTSQRVVQDEYTFQVSTDKENLTGVINQYLEEETQDSFIGYQFDLTDQVELHGSFSVLGFDLNFALFFEPCVLDNGNVQLQADSITLGQLDLPISFVLSQVARQVDFPHFIKINAHEEVINIELTNFELDNGIHFAAERLDLRNDILSILIYLPQEAI